MSEKSFQVMRAFEPFYHVGIGEWVHSRKDLSLALKRHGVEEIGTEDTRKRFKGMSPNEIKEEMRVKR